MILEKCSGTKTQREKKPPHHVLRVEFCFHSHGLRFDAAKDKSRVWGIQSAGVKTFCKMPSTFADSCRCQSNVKNVLIWIKKIRLVVGQYAAPDTSSSASRFGRTDSLASPHYTLPGSDLKWVRNSMSDRKMIFFEHKGLCAEHRARNLNSSSRTPLERSSFTAGPA